MDGGEPLGPFFLVCVFIGVVTIGMLVMWKMTDMCKKPHYETLL
jgi:hypothetical protein